MKNEHTVLAVDVGYGNTKAVWSRQSIPGKPGSWSQICFRSVCAEVVVADSDSRISTNSSDRVLVNVGDHRFFVGPKATSEGGLRALHPDYINTPEHEALLLGAWHYMFKATGKVTPAVDLLVLGLPVSSFQANKKKLSEIGSRPRRVPVPMHLQSTYGKTEVEVKARQVLVLPQPMGGLRLATDGNSAQELFDDSVIGMVIDPGYSTFDWFVTDGMAPQLELCGSFQGGVSQLLKAVSSQMAFDHGIGFENFGRIEMALAAGELNLHHKKIDMLPYRKIASKTASAVVAEFLQSFDPSKSNVSHIFVCGGGASFYIDALRARLPYSRIEVMPEGVMSNCRGYWLTGQDLLAD